MFYKLEDRTPVKCATGREWVDWFENAGEELIVGQDEIDGLFVLTVFTGIDQGGTEEPQLFETLFAVESEPTGTAIRYATWEEADRHHRKTVLQARTAAVDDAGSLH